MEKLTKDQEEVLNMQADELFEQMATDLDRQAEDEQMMSMYEHSSLQPEDL